MKGHPVTLPQNTEKKIGLWLYSSFNLGARWGGWLKPRPGRSTPGMTQYPFIVQEALWAP
jgi:hypothetical protein